LVFFVVVFLEKKKQKEKKKKSKRKEISFMEQCPITSNSLTIECNSINAYVLNAPAAITNEVQEISQYGDVG
jgi:hypothetical protein